MRRAFLAYLGLAVLIFCFVGIGSWFGDAPSSNFPDFPSIMGSFGCLRLPDGSETCDVVLRHGTGAKAGFVYCLMLVPSIMITCGILKVLRYWQTDQAAQTVFSWLVRLLSGLPGKATVPMFISLQSSDAGALAAKSLHDQGELNDTERNILVMWEFSSSGTLINVFSNGLALLPIIVTPVGTVLLVIIGGKFLGANLMRLFLYAASRNKEAA